MLVRLNKYLSQAGVCSRRQADIAIVEGRVEVNGEVVIEMGVQVDADADIVAFDGLRVDDTKTRRVCLAVNKPRGVVSTLADPHAQRTVAGLVPERFGRLFPVGRLDKDSQGLIVMTNDGDLANRLTHPSYGVEKEYIVSVDRALKGYELRKLAEGELRLSDGSLAGRIQVADAERSRHGNRRYYFMLREGRNREIRELMEALGMKVKRLKRLRIGPILLGNVPVGGWRQLTPEEEKALNIASPKKPKAAADKKGSGGGGSRGGKAGGKPGAKPRTNRGSKKPRR